MAGDDDRHGVPADGATHRPPGSRRADGTGEAAVARHGPEGDAPDGLEDAAVPGGKAVEVEGQLEVAAAPGEVGLELAGGLGSDPMGGPLWSDSAADGAIEPIEAAEAAGDGRIGVGVGRRHGDGQEAGWVGGHVEWPEGRGDGDDGDDPGPDPHRLVRLR
jgi:hypothetical protein